MITKANNFFDYEQLDLFEDPLARASKNKSLEQEHEASWEESRGRDYIQALGKNGKNVTLFFDHLDQQYYLMDE